MSGDCVSEKIRKLRREGYPQRQAVAIAIKMCNAGRATTDAGLDVEVDATPTPEASAPYRATRETDGWCIHDVEVCEPFMVVGTDGEEYEIDGEWLRRALDNVARDVRGGYRPPLNLRHRDIAPMANTTGEPPRPVGWWRPRGIRLIDYRGERVPVAVVDLCGIDDEHMERIERGEIKARSIEIMPGALPPDGEPYIHAIALLDVEPPAFKARALRVAREDGVLEFAAARSAWTTGAWVAQPTRALALGVARSAAGGGVEYATSWRRRAVGGRAMDPTRDKALARMDAEDKDEEGEARMEPMDGEGGDAKLDLGDVQDGIEKAKEIKKLLHELAEVFGYRLVPAGGDADEEEESGEEKSPSEIVAEAQPEPAELPAVGRSDATQAQAQPHELLGRLAAMEAWKKRQEREAAIARAVGKVAAELERYGFDDREKLLSVARSDGLKALERFADGVKAYGVISPPSQWTGEIPAGVIGASDPDDVRAVAQAYQPLGNAAVTRAEAYARKWDRCSDDYKRRVSREEWVEIQMRHDGFAKPVART